MGIRSLMGIRGARDKPQNNYPGSAFTFLFGRSTSGKPVNERTAMQTTAVYSCVRILAETTAGLLVWKKDCVTYRKSSGKGGFKWLIVR